jgi:hypothetical protein
VWWWLHVPPVVHRPTARRTRAAAVHG